MSIEGAEYDVIRHLPAVGVVRHIDLCFIELHSTCMTGTRKQEHENLEMEYRGIVHQDIPHFRAWY